MQAIHIDEAGEARDEAGRLAAVEACGLLEGPPEESFERLTRVACRMLRVPMAIVNVVGKTLHAKGHTGLTPAFGDLAEYPGAKSYCRQVVERDGPLVLGDLSADPYTRANAFILADAASYLGVPVHSPDGQAIASLCVLDRTPRVWSQDDVEAMRELAAAVESEIRLRDEVARRSAADAAMTERQAQLDLAMSSAEGKVGVWGWDVTSRVVSMDPAFAGIFGVDPAGATNGLPIDAFIERIHPEDRVTVTSAVEEAVRRIGPYAVEHRVIRPDGTETWIQSRGRCIAGEDGLPRRFVGVVVDVTEQKLESVHQAEMAREMGHRMKNLLQMVQAMITQTLRESPDTASASKAIMARIQAMATAQDLLTASNWEGARLRSAIESTAVVFGGGRFVVTGPDVMLKPRAALSVSMALHELATNAVKYGALSVPGGKVHVTWDEASDGALTFEWREEGGPPVVEPTRKGFGTRLLQRVLASEIGGQTVMDYDPSGLRCRIVGTAAA